VDARTRRASPKRGNIGNVLSVFITLATLAVVGWAVIDVARRPAVVLAGKWKALWIVGMVGAWFLFGPFGATISAVYLVGPRRRLNSVTYSGDH
jgi:hypothetical protein